ncbi:uncharacterized protein LOC112349861 [Selaginella moellendorffii]|uniref:uncharacterized protein LOC112343332 n=1 Tax=Selaginella moellendorffii TaxID=88036 RepID=UPI000D1C26DB|nr:uncharacterized protein LOC112343332 [Selaginella moellendorffii]XP_024540787.1 uncharacterized protein LOC112349861 [Selaginella moellendorffii]|eukprot:XP_024522361.1 uncharacterized protein LOC112343332 [Selaginella moellendorffii]
MPVVLRIAREERSRASKDRATQRLAAIKFSPKALSRIRVYVSFISFAMADSIAQPRQRLFHDHAAIAFPHGTGKIVLGFVSVRASSSSYPSRNSWLSAGNWRRLSLVSSPPSSSIQISTLRKGMPQQSSAPAQEDEDYTTWERVQLLERLLRVAVSDENYGEAVKLRDILGGLKAELTATERVLLKNTKLLDDGDVSERIQAIEALGDFGDKRIFPTLSACLRDENHNIVLETEKAMWRIFMRSGRDDVDKRIQEGVSKMVGKDGLAAAREIFTEVINMAPSFAEGYNKRATVHYLLQDYHKSIEDCQRTLKLNPYHFAALSGLGLCYVAIQDPESALCWLEKAYAMHPGLVQISKYIKVLKKKIKEKQAKKEDK